MSTTHFDALRSDIDTHHIPHDPSADLIAINRRYASRVYFDPSTFTDIAFNYINAKLDTDSINTDTDNNFQAIRAINVIYLDGDYIFPPTIDPQQFSRNTESILTIYHHLWTEELNRRNIDSYYFIFVPLEFTLRKGGFHVFIYCSAPITVDDRTDMYNAVRHRILNVEASICRQLSDLLGITIADFTTNYDHIFDAGPIKSMQTLLPFAQKSHDSRQYTLLDTNYDPQSPPDYFIIGTTQSLPASASDLFAPAPTTSIFATSTVRYNISDVKNDDGKAAGIALEFIQSLRYLSHQHFFWKTLADNTQRRIRIIQPLVQFIAVNSFIERWRPPYNENDCLVHCITSILVPLLRVTTVNLPDGATERDTYASCFAHVKSVYDTYSFVKGLTPELAESWRRYKKMSLREYNSLDINERNDLDRDVSRFRSKALKMYSSWFHFVKGIVLNGITDEIRPFRRVDNPADDPRNGVTFEEVVPKQVNVNPNVELSVSFYTHTLRRWFMMFIFTEFLNSESMTETMRSIICAFIRYFIWYRTSDSNNRVYIYNIKQTRELARYPYNQWLYDGCGPDAGKCLKTWIKSIYYDLVKPEIEAVHRAYNLDNLLTNVIDAKLYRVNNTTVKPLAMFDRDTDIIFRNVLSSFAQERWDPPVELDPVSSNYFPMRNGIIEFHNDGTYTMHYNNHDRYMTVYTNISYDDNYDYGNDCFKAVQTMWRQIFPVQDERDYSLKIFASALVGSILKDMFVIPYGTGGDGKTISNNAMMGMLGSDGLVSHVQIEEDGTKEYVENPFGLATTMKTETILVSAKQGHDSGGIIQLRNKRFCTIQEPDPNVSNGKLNCSKIKEILSGSSLTGREIYKQAEMFTPNCIITLQTNILLGYTEDTDAIRRRITVVPFRSKFTTAINADKFDTLEYTFPANPKLGIALVNDPKYWQALFYTLLPYAKELLRDGIRALSDIPRPDSIVRATIASFAQSNGLVGWLNANVVKRDGYAISVPDMVRRIILAHEAEKSNGYILTSSKAADRKHEIHAQLIGTYMGRIYKVRDEFYTVSREGLIPGFEVEDGEGKTNDELVRNYFDPHAVNNMEFSKLTQKSDLYIVGYAFKSDIEGDVL